MADPLSIAGSIAGLVGLAEVLFRRLYNYGKAVRGAREELKKFTGEVLSFHGLLQSLKIVAEELAEEPAFIPSTLPFIHDCQTILEKLDNAFKKASASTSWKWPLRSSETKELLQDLQRQKSTLSVALATQDLKVVLRALSGIEKIQEDVEELSRRLEAVSRIIITKDTQKLLDDFSSLVPRQDYEASLNLRHKGTGRWVIQSEDFRSWMESKNSGLWLFGIPGAGKTIISATIIEHIIPDTIQPSSDSALVYFFCDYKSVLKQSPQNIMASLVRQLARQHQTSYDKAASYHRNQTLNAEWSPPPTEELCNLFAEMCESFKDVMVVVDGIDECGKDQGKAAEVLCGLKSHSQNVKVLLLSREEPDIQHQLRSFQSMSIAAQNKDLRLYVAAEIEKRIQSKELQIRDVSLKKEIMDTLITGAAGMFRWVTCQIDYICELPTDSSRRKALKSLPPTLSETYERIIERANKKDKYSQDILQRALRWVVTWRTPFPIEALCEAVSIEPEHTEVSIDSVPLRKKLLQICSSFLRIIWGDRLEPAHFTVKVCCMPRTV